MSSLQQSLRALQAIDSEIEAYRQRIRALQAELADDKALAAARSTTQQAQEEHRTAEATLRDDEQTLERLTRVISTLDKRLYDGSIHNAKEAASVEEELRHRRKERADVEDRVFATMERVETAAPAATTAQARLADVERTRAARLPTLKAEGREATARLTAAREQRAALAAATPPAILSRYERLHATTAPAVVTVSAGGACGGCGVAVPSALQQKVGAGELIQCLNCNRILVQ